MRNYDQYNLQGYKYTGTVIDEETGKAMEYRKFLKDKRYKETWSIAGSNECGRLLQGIGENDNRT